jgi:predicted AAA+ superfamily ATPase
MQNQIKTNLEYPPLTLRFSMIKWCHDTTTALQGHPKLGLSWEGFAIEQIIGALETRNTYFWATHAGAELDLLVMAKGKRFGFELKYADAPGRRRSMLIALEDLQLEHLWVVYPGDQAYELDDRISVIPIADLTRLTTLIS